ncbi:MAG: hypothetical protein WCJ01_04945 [Ignavibacteria bacterium]
MKLSKKDSDLFYRLMSGLQAYVNKQLKIIPYIDTMEKFRKFHEKSKLTVRNALWENPRFINNFVQENPEKFPPDELEIINGWGRFIMYGFFIYRYMKDYTLLIGNEHNVYAVLGISNGIDEVYYKKSLPILVKAVLLPFKGCIVYDGVFDTYDVGFTLATHEALKQDYIYARENNTIIMSLDSGNSVSNLIQATNVAKPVVNNNWGARDFKPDRTRF